MPEHHLLGWGSCGCCTITSRRRSGNSSKRKAERLQTGEYFYHLKLYAAILEAYLSNLATKIGASDQLDRAASDLQAKRERRKQAKDRLISIWDDTRRASLF